MFKSLNTVELSQEQLLLTFISLCAINVISTTTTSLLCAYAADNLSLNIHQIINYNNCVINFALKYNHPSKTVINVQ